MKALILAKYIISKCYNDGNPVTNLKLQKMLYFLFGNYYAEFNEYLFKDDFVAWKLGPVVLDVYFEFNNNISNPISEVYDIDLNLDDKKINFIDKNINELCKNTTWDLVERSHKTEPWIESFRKGKGSIIDKYSIAECFLKNNTNEKRITH